jgi:hypothetical protein
MERRRTIVSVIEQSHHPSHPPSKVCCASVEEPPAISDWRLVKRRRLVISHWRLGTAAISDLRLVSRKAMKGRIKALLPKPQWTALAFLYVRLGKANAPIELVR